MPRILRLTLSGWKPVVLLFLLAVSLLVVSYRIDREESRLPETKARNLSATSPGQDPAPGSNNVPVRPLVPPTPENGTASGSDTPGPSFSIPSTLDPREPARPYASTTTISKRLGRPVTVLHGQVFDPGGSPIANAEVRLGKRSCHTDSLGEFTIPRGTDELVIDHPDYFSRRLTAADRRELMDPVPSPEMSDGSLEPSSIRRPLRVVLFLGSRVRGHVHDQRDAPISGATLRFSPLEGGLDLATRPGSILRSQGDGSYESPLLHPGTYHVLVQHSEYQSLTDTITVPPKKTSVAFDAVLSPGEQLRLTVRDKNARPLADARVWLDRRREGESSEETQFLGLTDDKGLLESRRESNGPGGFVQHWVRVNLPGYREVRRPVESSELVVNLASSPCIDGIGVDETQGLPQPVRRVRLEMETQEGYLRVPDQGILLHSLPAGRFRIGLPALAGTYRVRVEAEGRLVGSSDRIVFDGHTSPSQLTVRLRPRGGLQGVVRADNSTVSDVVIELYRDLPAPQRLFYGLRLPSPSAPHRVTRTDTHGMFEFEDIEPGTYRLRTRSKHHASLYSAPVVSPASELVPLVLAAGAALRGSVLDAEGKPEFGVSIVLVCLDRPFPQFATSDPTGSYRFDHLADGRYVLIPGGDATFGGESTFSWTGADSDISNTKLDNQVISIAGKRDVTFNLHLASFPWGSIDGVLKSDSEPLANHEIRLSPVSASNGRAREIRTDTSGRFRAHGLSPGLYRLESSYPPFVREARIEAGKRATTPIDVRSHPLTLEVVHARTGRRVPTTVHARLTRVSNSNLSGGTVTHRVRSRLGRDEPLKLEKLYAGIYRIEVRASGFLPETRRIEMGEVPARVSIALRPGIPIRVTMTGSTPLRGHGKITVTRNGVESYRFEGYVDGEVLLPEFEPGVYQMAVESGGETVRSSFKILP
jgi:protocatechuate 3,4-dioxygenase beta subunit